MHPLGESCRIPFSTKQHKRSKHRGFEHCEKLGVKPVKNVKLGIEPSKIGLENQEKEMVNKV
jgi:hypothetical protein